MIDEFDDDPFGDDKLFTVAHKQFQGREFTREADGRWFDEWRYELKPGPDGKPVILKPSGKPSRPPPPYTEPYTTHSLRRWLAQNITDPPWFMENWIPLGHVVGLYGRPGSRKSTLLLQWMIACALGKGFGHTGKLRQGASYGLFCEDDEMEIARRARAILNGYSASFADLQDCHAESLVTANLTQFFSFRRSGLMIPTPAWEKFNEDLDDINPVFVCLDVAANFFGGNEINRTETTAFLRLLDKTAQERSFAMVFSYHPSLRGLRDATLSSGSTAWEGGVRSRMTIEDPTDDDEDDPNRLPNQSDRRILTLAKASYAKNGATEDLVIRNGFFLPADLDPITQKLRNQAPADQAAAQRHFLNRLKTRLDQGRYVSPKKGNAAGFAPTELAGNGFTASMLETAMIALFDTGVLTFDPTKRNPTERWIINDTKLPSPNKNRDQRDQ